MPVAVSALTRRRPAANWAPPDRMRTMRPRLPVLLPIGAAGLVTLVVGTFLPWLRSGEVRRNSYTSFGLLRRLIGFPGPAEPLLRAWPLLGAVCAAVVLVAVAGWPRVAAGLSLLVAAWSATVAGGAL